MVQIRLIRMVGPALASILWTILLFILSSIFMTIVSVGVRLVVSVTRAFMIMKVSRLVVLVTRTGADLLRRVCG